jgi:transposase
LSIKKIKNEWLLLISSRVQAPMQIYKKRWSIEVFFKSIKTSGFNIEKTKITKPDRLKLLFAMCSMAYLMCTIIGTHIDLHYECLRRKKDGKSLILSFFRAGADWLKDQVHRHSAPYNHLATLILVGL